MMNLEIFTNLYSIVRGVDYFNIYYKDTEIAKIRKIRHLYSVTFFLNPQKQSAKEFYSIEDSVIYIKQMHILYEKSLKNAEKICSIDSIQSDNHSDNFEQLDNYNNSSSQSDNHSDNSEQLDNYNNSSSQSDNHSDNSEQLDNYNNSSTQSDNHSNNSVQLDNYNNSSSQSDRILQDIERLFCNKGILDRTFLDKFVHKFLLNIHSSIYFGTHLCESLTLKRYNDHYEIIENVNSIPKKNIFRNNEQHDLILNKQFIDSSLASSLTCHFEFIDFLRVWPPLTAYKNDSNIAKPQVLEVSFKCFNKLYYFYTDFLDGYNHKWYVSPNDYIEDKPMEDTEAVMLEKLFKQDDVTISVKTICLYDLINESEVMMCEEFLPSFIYFDKRERKIFCVIDVYTFETEVDDWETLMRYTRGVVKSQVYEVRFSSLWETDYYIEKLTDVFKHCNHLCMNRHYPSEDGVWQKNTHSFRLYDLTQENTIYSCNVNKRQEKIDEHEAYSEYHYGSTTDYVQVCRWLKNYR